MCINPIVNDRRQLVPHRPKWRFRQPAEVGCRAPRGARVWVLISDLRLAMVGGLSSCSGSRG
jgi:hypothetical protein